VGDDFFWRSLAIFLGLRVLQSGVGVELVVPCYLVLGKKISWVGFLLRGWLHEYDHVCVSDLVGSWSTVGEECVDAVCLHEPGSVPGCGGCVDSMEFYSWDLCPVFLLLFFPLVEFFDGSVSVHVVDYYHSMSLSAC